MYVNRDKNKFKTKTYLTQENNDENENNDNNCQKVLNYFASNYDEIDDSENTILINNASSIEIVC